MIMGDSEILAEKSKKFLFVAAMLLALFLIILVAFVISFFIIAFMKSKVVQI